MLLQVYIMPEGIEQLQRLAQTAGGAYVTDLVQEAINDLLQKYGLPPVA